jgi:hypothetical protein
MYIKRLIGILVLGTCGLTCTLFPMESTEHSLYSTLELAKNEIKQVAEALNESEVQALSKTFEQLLTENLSSEQLKALIIFFVRQYRKALEKRSLLYDTFDFCDNCYSQCPAECCIMGSIAGCICMSKSWGAGLLALACCLVCGPIVLEAKDAYAPNNKAAIAISRQFASLIGKCLELLRQREGFSYSTLIAQLQEFELTDPYLEGLARDIITQDHSKLD